jgi:hypothetical protein
MTASVPFTAPLMPPLTGASTSVRFLGFESLRDQLGRAGSGGRQIDQDAGAVAGNDAVRSQRDGLDDVRGRQADEHDIRCSRRPRRAILQDARPALDQRLGRFALRVVNDSE